MEKTIDEAFRALEQYDIYIGHEEIVDKLKDLIQQDKIDTLDSVVDECENKSEIAYLDYKGVDILPIGGKAVSLHLIRQIVDKLKSELK
jgi:hypothetical protein